ncbi:MAG TPA: hypothetical protein VEV62_17790 [Parafilimonas sp.]|nr:hypothetical protein [Parafilimonas sp.]
MKSIFLLYYSEIFREIVGCILNAIVFCCGSNIRSSIKLIDAALRAFFPEIGVDNLLNERKATVEIIDKKDESGKSIGTKVILVFVEE